MRKKFQVRVRRGGYRYSYGFCSTLEEASLKQEIIEERMDKEERTGHIVGAKGELLSGRFKIGSKMFDIVGTESKGKTAFDALDTVKNVKTKEITEITRQKLFDTTRKKKKNG